jgi:hypothetical protein
MKKLMGNTLFFGLVLLVVSTFVPAVSSAQVAVFGECAYTNTDLVCNLYVNTEGSTLVSGGVALSYDSGKLSSPVAERNESDWYFGEASGTKYAYMAPEIDTANHKVVCIVGKLRQSAPTEGVNSARSLMVKVTFTRSESGDPGHGAAAATYFGLGLSLAKSAPFDNFVTTSGDKLDAGIVYQHPNFDPPLPIQVAERGDANASGTFTAADYVVVRNYLSASDFPPYVDCNASGSITAADYTCIRNKLP